MSAVRAGFTLLELLIALAIAALLIGALAGVVDGSLGAWEQTRERHRLSRDARFALERMTASVSRTRRLLLPLAENPATAWSESVRDVLAVTLDPETDRDGDGFADADNDRDGRIDEDPGSDSTKDAAPGIHLVDDDGDGNVDESAPGDDDEDGAVDEDPRNGIDDDGDGAVDEDAAADMNGDGAPGSAGVDDDGDSLVDEGVAPDDDEDGSQNEDWPATVVYRLQGTTLVERMPDLGGIDGRAYTERPIAEHVTGFRVERLPAARATLVDITLDLTGGRGETVSLHTRLRVGAGP